MILRHHNKKRPKLELIKYNKIFTKRFNQLCEQYNRKDLINASRINEIESGKHSVWVEDLKNKRLYAACIMKKLTNPKENALVTFVQAIFEIENVSVRAIPNHLIINGVENRKYLIIIDCPKSYKLYSQLHPKAVLFMDDILGNKVCIPFKEDEDLLGFVFDTLIPAQFLIEGEKNES